MTFTASTGVYGILRSNDRQTFTTIDNQTLQNDSLSYKATGFLTKLLSLPPNWKIQVDDLMSRFNMGRYSVLQRLRELQEAGYLIRQKLKDEVGRFYYIHIIRETPSTIGKINGGLGGEVLDASDSNGSSIVRFSVGGESVDGKPNLLINNNSIKERTIKDPLTNEVADVVIFSDKNNNTEPLEVPVSEPAQIEPLAISEILEKEDLPAAYDRPKPKESQQSYQIQLAAKLARRLATIGVAIQNVEWVIRQIKSQERDRVVSDAIAWVAEQKWVEQPAAAFVSAVRRRMKSARVVDAELRQIIDTHSSEAQQFSQWYGKAKRRGHIEYSQGDREHYALVTLPDGVTLPWQQARDFLAVLMTADDELHQ
jgi:hypothetical protein